MSFLLFLHHIFYLFLEPVPLRGAILINSALQSAVPGSVTAYGALTRGVP